MRDDATTQCDDAMGELTHIVSPLAKLNRISPRGWKELAARRRGEEPGGALGVQSARYFDLVREMKNVYNHRLLELVIGLAVFPLVFVSHGGSLL